CRSLVGPATQAPSVVTTDNSNALFLVVDRFDPEHLIVLGDVHFQAGVFEKSEDAHMTWNPLCSAKGASMLAAMESLRQPEVTDRDRENARIRQKIAEDQDRVWTECCLMALEEFGPGWFPRGKHFLIEKDEEERHRREGGKLQVAATVYTVQHEDGRQRHF